MSGRSAKCTVVNQTGETLTLQNAGAAPTTGTWTTAPPATCDKQVDFGVAGDSGAEGSVTYTGAGGSALLTWSVPGTGPNSYLATPSGGYAATFDGNEVGIEGVVTYTLTKTADASAQATAPKADADAGPEDHTHQSHVPLRASGPVVLSPKRWLVDIAWQAINHMEWDPLILEVTENRHGEYAAANCPKTMVPVEGVKVGSPPLEKCNLDHAKIRADYEAREAKYEAEKAKLVAAGSDSKTAAATARATYPSIQSDFHSWCGDFITWVFWKAWMLGKHDADGKTALALFLNREAVRGSWVPGDNLSYFEKYAQKNQTLKYHPFSALKPADYVPQPGDVAMVNRDAGGHISMLASWNPTALSGGSHHNFITLDGKSFDSGNTFDWGADPADATKEITDKDPGWNSAGVPADPATRQSPSTAKPQGAAQTERATSDTNVVSGKTLPLIRAWIDTSQIRTLLGYR